MDIVEVESLLDGWTFGSGVGDAASQRACLVSAAAFVAGEAFSDRPSCVCPVIARPCIRVNDAAWWHGDAERTETLRPIVALIVGTRSTPDVEKRRRYIAVDFATREVVPMAFDNAADVLDRRDRDGSALRAYAVSLRALAPIVDEETQAAGREVLRAARSAAADAYAADDAAYAAYAYAYAADAAAADAADAAAYAAYAYAPVRLAAKRPFRDAAIECIKRMCAVT